MSTLTGQHFQPHDPEGVFKISFEGRTVTVKHSVVQQPPGQTEDEREEFHRWFVKNGPALVDALQQAQARNETQQTLLGATEKLEAQLVDNQADIWKRPPVPESSLETTPDYDTEAQLEDEREMEKEARGRLKRIGCPPCCPPEVGYPVTESDLQRLSEIDRGATVFHMRGAAAGMLINPVATQCDEWFVFFKRRQARLRKVRGLQAQQQEVNEVLKKYGLHFDPDLKLESDFRKQSIVQNLAEYLAWKQESYEANQKEHAESHHAVAREATEVLMGQLKGVIAWTVHHIRVFARILVATQDEPASHARQAGTAEAKTQGRKRKHDDSDNGKEEETGGLTLTELPAKQKRRHKRRKKGQQGVQQGVQQRAQRQTRAQRESGALGLSPPQLHSSRSTRRMARARPDTQFFHLDDRGSAQLVPAPGSPK